MRSLFELCRERVTALQAAERYGMQFGRNRRALCPWHDDRHPDLAFYDERCYCHACHNGGDAVALVGQLFSLTPLEAAQKINSDFGLGHDGSVPIPSGPSRVEIRRDLENWRRKRWGYLCDVEREANAELERAKDWDTPRFTQVLQALAKVQDELELLRVATIEDLEDMAHG